MQTYLWINILLISIPLAFSFSKKLAFYKVFIYLLPAILIPAALFLTLDYFFMVWKITGFNAGFVTGIYWFSLPFEEVLFFITMPCFSIFIYTCIKIFSEKDKLRAAQKLLTAFFLLISLLLFFAYPKHLFTAIISLLTSFLLICHSWISRTKSLSIFYLVFFTCLAPYIIIKFILISMSVIWYDPMGITGIKIFLVPVEEILYFLSLFLMNIGIFEYAKKTFSKGKSTEPTESSTIIRPVPTNP